VISERDLIAGRHDAVAPSPVGQRLLVILVLVVVLVAGSISVTRPVQRRFCGAGLHIDADGHMYAKCD
jgi:hypothetical protein